MNNYTYCKFKVKETLKFERNLKTFEFLLYFIINIKNLSLITLKYLKKLLFSQIKTISKNSSKNMIK